jgi:hypothetical protein
MARGGGDLRLLAMVLVAVLAAAAVLALFGAPLLAQASAALAPGVGLKTAALWGFGVTVALLVLLALVAGDGLLGELQFLLGAFFSFFAVITLLIAWVF